MKAQKLGLVLGINMVAACLMMQGCADPKSPKGQKLAASRNATTIASPSSTDRKAAVSASPSSTDQTITIISRPGPASRPTPVAVSPIAEPQVAQPILQEPVITATTTPAPAPVVQETPPPAPSSVRTVKKLPTAPAKAPKTKPAAAPAKTGDSSAAAPTEYYVIQPGDSLSKISKKTNFRQDAILAANPGIKDRNIIRVGQKIKLPGAVAASAVAKTAAPAAKDVAAKDVAAKDVAAKGDAAKDDAAKEGDAKDKVKLAAAPAPAAANTAAPVKTKGGFIPYEGPTKDYVVKSGDSMGQIAVSYGISIRALKALNGLKGDALRAGQKLKVPAEKQTAAKPVSATPAIVAKGDDAKAATAAPAVKEKEAATPALAANTVKAADSVKADVKVEEPEKKVEEAAKVEEVTPPAEAPAAPAQLTHTVKDGEDLVSIAIAYGISPSALMDLNDLKPTDEVKPGQKLKLPANAKQ